MDNVPKIQTKIMDNDTLTKHRAYIAVKAQSLMGRYFQIPQDELVKRDILLGWMDMLQDYTQEEIDYACKQYLIDFPNKRPHEGHIRQVIANKRKRTFNMHKAKSISPPPRKNQNAEQRKRLAKELMLNIGKV
jgi:hypothetical protein